MKIINDKGLPLAIIRALEKDNYDGPNPKDPWKISVTTLDGPARIRRLKLLYWDDIVIDASQMLWALHGQAIHGILERGAVPGGVYELRLEMPWPSPRGPITISGQIDCWEDGVLTDYKNRGVYAGEALKNEDIAQLNVLAWLMREHHFDVSSLQNVFFFRDWHYLEKPKRGYPATMISAPIPVPYWSQDQTYAYIQARVNAHYSDDVPECTSEERWGNRRCKRFCLVASHCSQWANIQDAEEGQKSANWTEAKWASENPVEKEEKGN